MYKRQASIDALRRLVEANLASSRFFEAYDLAQNLREKAPGRADSFELLGRACLGLGLFDEAAACAVAALQLEPDRTQSANMLVWLLAVRGDGHELLSTLSEQGKMDINLLSRLEAMLDATEKPSKFGGVLETSSETITVPLSDTLRIPMTINGKTARLLFDTSFVGLTLGDDFATLAGLKPEGNTMVQGLADTGFAVASQLVLHGIRLGNATFKDLPALVIPDLDRTGRSEDNDGVVGPGILAGFSYRIDRKGEKLQFFPPGKPLPKPAGPAVTQPYYTLDSHIMTDVVIRNRINNQAWKVKMSLVSGSQITLFNHSYAERLGFGKIDSTRTVTLVGSTNYTKGIQVSFSEIQLGGANFAFDRFFAVTDTKRKPKHVSRKCASVSG